VINNLVFARNQEYELRTFWFERYTRLKRGVSRLSYLSSAAVLLSEVRPLACESHSDCDFVALRCALPGGGTRWLAPGTVELTPPSACVENLLMSGCCIGESSARRGQSTRADESLLHPRLAVQ
jgi:hypothetical protein